ncbi:MAG TPA: hypothetical protein DCS93_10015 [Microscillaceae bacterium]|nr:hypothetical protein [Microscillaceae bacterium]
MNHHVKIENSLPDIELSKFVKEFVYLTIDSSEKQSIVAIDDGCYDFMFYKEKKANLFFGKANSAKINHQIFTVHQASPPLKYNFGKRLSFFTIKVQPWANAYFFPNHFKHPIVPLSLIYGNKIDKLQELLFECATFKEKVQLAKRFIREILPNTNEQLELIRRVCQDIYSKQGMITVNELADKYHLNRQFLNKIFYQLVNYTIKKFIIIVRIMNLAKFKINHAHLSLTEVALEFGYYDQAHFNYDFKRISGVTPTFFFKNLPPFFIRHKKR